MTSGSGDVDLMVRAAWLYYRDGLTQAQVAKRLFVSRQTVGRLLEAALEQGIVRIEIEPGHMAAMHLASEARSALRLEDAVVVPADAADVPFARRNERVAAAAAAYLRRFLHPGVVVGVGWGDTVARVLGMLTEESLDGVTIASASGWIQQFTESLAASSVLAKHLKLVPAPMVASSPEAAQMFMKEDAVRDALSCAEQAGVTLSSVGSATPAASAVRSGLVSDDDVARFAAMGAVGDMMGEWFDSRGRPLRGATSDRRIGIALERLRSLPNVIVVAAGLDKAEALLAAIRAGYVKVLVTDEPTVLELLRR
ncbi:sugar-binding transcriptional regulator [Raineyella fluvialis]|nr:sugar-binding domain-containing protein [Raineyella fluvialis]